MISDGADPKATIPHHAEVDGSHIDRFDIAVKIQPMLQIADHIVRFQSWSIEALSTIGRDLRAVKWRLWLGRFGSRDP